jgi:hypothetical protein
MNSRLIILCLLIAAAMPLGCITDRPFDPAATQPATVIDAKLATSEYWLAQPITEQVTHADFTTVWETCEQVAHDYFFKIARRNFRSGLLTTEPAISKQLLEFWRKDAGTPEDVKEASIAAIRRTIYFQVTKNSDGGYSVAPKVIVERESRVDPKFRAEETDLPVTYWYALRRDSAMESQLAAAIRQKLSAPAK